MKPTRTILLALAAAAAPAAAHITFADPRAPAGSYYAGFLRVSHGCDGSETVSLRVEIPDSVSSAKPQPKPGWTLAIETQPLPAPIKAEGGTVSTRVSAIVWTGHLSPDMFDQFGIMMKLPAAAGPLYFPATQRCARGANAWTMIPAPGQPWHSVPKPAPVVTVMSASADAHGGGMGGMGAMPEHEH